MMGTYEAIIVCCTLAFILNMVILVQEVRAYRAAKRRRRHEKTVHVRADELATVIAEFIRK